MRGERRDEFELMLMVRRVKICDEPRFSWGSEAMVRRGHAIDARRKIVPKLMSKGRQEGKAAVNAMEANSPGEMMN